MTDPQLSIAAEDEHRHDGLPRYLGAALTGAIFSLFAANALQVGFEYTFAAEEPWHTWTTFLWGDHYILMTLSNLASTGVGAFVAGVVARRHGGVTAISAQLPAIVAWGVRSYFAWASSIQDKTVGIEPISPPYRFAYVLLLVATPFLAYTIGGRAMPIGQELASHFDRRRWTVLGIKWFHYLWLPVLLTAILSQIAYAAYYSAALFLAGFAGGRGILGSVAGFLTIVVAISVKLVWKAGTETYLILAGFTSEPSTWEQTKHLFKAGVGRFLLGTLLCGAVRLTHWYLSSKLGWFQ